MFLGEIIKKYRIAHDLTMQDFANASGLSKSYISIIEKNKNPQNQRTLIPSLDTFQKAANAMGLSIDELVRMTDDNQKISLSKKSPNLNGFTNLIMPAAYPVPMLGAICASDGVWCEENYQGTFYVDKSIRADLCLEVKGDSMIDAGINNGDIVFIRKSSNYDNGKIYAVVINSDNEAVLKRVYWSDNKVILNPCNAEYEPIIAKADDITVVGECVGVYHSTNY